MLTRSCRDRRRIEARRKKAGRERQRGAELLPFYPIPSHHRHRQTCIHVFRVHAHANHHLILLSTTLPTLPCRRHLSQVLNPVSTKSRLHFTQAHTNGCKIPSRVRPQGFVSRVTPLPPPPRVPFRSTAAQTGLYSLDSALEIDGCPLLD